MYSVEIVWTFDGKSWRTIIIKNQSNDEKPVKQTIKSKDK
jgi:hypothetical protein